MDTPQPEVKKEGIFKKPWVQSLFGVIVIVAALLGAIVYKSTSSRVAIDHSVISAPVIVIGPLSEGALQSVFVKAGDMVTKGEPVAQVGGEVLSAQVDGLVLDVVNTPGQIFMSGQEVVSMIDPSTLRIIGTIDEDKGLSKIKVGDPVSFTVDAFGGNTYTGVVDEIGPTSNDSGVAFTISDKRETKQFDIKVAYDIAAHPEFKNGMSAKMKVFPQK